MWYFPRPRGPLRQLLCLALVVHISGLACVAAADPCIVGPRTPFPGHAIGPGPFPEKLSLTGLFQDTTNLIPAPGVLAYDVNTPLWSDGAQKRRWIALPGLETLEFDASGAWKFPLGTVFVKHFEIPTPGSEIRRLETRVFLHRSEGWIGYTYRWNAEGTDADLLLDGLDEPVVVDFGNGPESLTWRYPSPADCLGCHSFAAGRVLGGRARQLNRSFAYPEGADNQLHAWSCLGLFGREIAPPGSYGAYAPPEDAGASLLRRSRAYLATNCAICHQPQAPAPGGLDMRFDRLLGGMNLINVPPSEGDLGLTDPRRIKPGAKEQSVLWHRVQSTDPRIRMPQGSRAPDPVAVQLLGAWIDTALDVLDSDEDGTPDASDNCRFAPNPGQLDSGGTFSYSSDGIGDACQCGDSNGDGLVGGQDAVSLRHFLAGRPVPLPPEGHRRCPARDGTGLCTVTDVVRLRRVQMGLDPELEQSCRAATELDL